MSDAAAIAAIYAPHVSESATSFEIDPPSAKEMEQRIVSTLARTPWLVLVRDGVVAGYAYASAHRQRAAYAWSVDVSVYVDSAYRKARIGRALYTSLLRLLPQQNFCVAHAGITLPNDASVRLHESCGFRPIGIYAAVGFKLGAWHDVGWWRLPLRDRPSDPGPILPLDEVRTKPAWTTALESGLEHLT